MVGCQMLAKLDNRLSYAKHNPSEVPFGGIDMVFAGKYTSNIFAISTI